MQSMPDGPSGAALTGSPGNQHAVAFKHRRLARQGYLMEQIGFQREGTRRERSPEDDGRYYDTALYELLRRDLDGKARRG